MSNEEAIKRLKEARFTIQPYQYINEALDMAIEALKAQPCEDAVSREAVHDMVRKLKRWCVRSEDGKFNNVGLLYDDMQFGIDNLPPVQPKSGWIPVSERLPEKDGLYLVSGKGKVWVCKLLNLMGVKGWCGDVRNPPVKAWMPLPEPYKENEE